MLDEEAWNEYINQDDPVIGTAMRVFKNKSAFPKRPVKKVYKGKVAMIKKPFDNIGLKRNFIVNV